MAFGDKDDIELKMKARKELSNAKDPLTKLRLQCMCNGASGIKGLSRRFRLMNEDDDKFLSKTEFKNGIKGFGLMVTDAEIDELFKVMDKDGSNTISMAEFLRAIRPEIPESRLKLIKKAFTLMDKTGDGVITIHDMQNVYNAKKHPKYLSGDWSETRVFQEFLKSFEAPNDADGQVTWEEFFDYYSSISDSIDGDSYFDLMMRNSYKM